MENLMNGSHKMHDETESFMSLLEKNSLLDGFYTCTPEDARARSEAISSLCADDVTFEGKVNEFTIPSSTCQGGIPVTVYMPRDLGMKPAIVVYFHGGGMMSGTRTTAASICQQTAQRGGCIVVNVVYRSPPEHKLPDAINDAVGAVRWVIFNKGLLGAKHNSSVGVMGDSGGGLIAAQLAQELAGISFQILIYPKLHLSEDSDSYNDTENDGPLCSRGDVSRFIKDAVDEETSPKSLLRCHPGQRENFPNLPPALFVVAECDPTKDDAHDYMKKLKDAKLKATVVTVRGTYHGFFHLPGHFKACCTKAMDRVSDFIKSHSDYNHLQLLN